MSYCSEIARQHMKIETYSKTCASFFTFLPVCPNKIYLIDHLETLARRVHKLTDENILEIMIITHAHN